MKAILTALSLALVLAFSAGALAKEDKKAETRTITGKSSCAECDGVAKASEPMHIMLTDKAGTRWVLIGDSESYKAAHKVRHEGKSMTATYAGEPVTRKGEDGKEYKEVKVSDVKVEA